MPPKQAIAKSHTALKTLIETTSPANLQKALLSALPNSTDEELGALSNMLSSVKKAASTQKHCVRCHDTFYENQNHPKACTIQHTDEADTVYVGNTLVAVMLCCGFRFDPEQNNPSKFCILATHTTNPKDVKYYDEDEEDGNVNVITCEETGCVKTKRKGASSNGPAKKK
ncbi:hypothetical protein FIBSPDRAFT_1048371 [Athelia psychrophila]|uniref:Uncharacterized protein n=1 Tax=Athelia psychrophila TaxID=1759441 RepID=A0A166DWS8_9AGAM|nr:hypothetical protein FIBSPDRAFT_1048371 [Fibularhizoctonia sp. CBS 109695]